MPNSGDLDQPPDGDLFNPAMLALMTRVLDGAWAEA